MSNFDLKDKLDRHIYSLYNITSDIVFNINWNKKRLVSPNCELKNIHKNKKCFIIGTGPSINDLTNDNFTLIKENISFAVNLFYKYKQISDFVPDYYALIDPLFASKKYHSVCKDIHNKYPKTTFFADYRAKALLDSLNLKKKSYFIYAKKYPINAIDENISANSYITLNVVSTCILIAIYMGIKEIYLVGCDYNSFASQKEVHFYDESEELGSNIEGRLAYLLKFYHLTTEFHYLIARLAKKRGVNIVNLCPHSLLDAYPRNNFNIFSNE